MLREALRRMGRADLIGNGKHQLVPAYQPAGTGGSAEGSAAAACIVRSARSTPDLPTALARRRDPSPVAAEALAWPARPKAV